MTSNNNSSDGGNNTTFGKTGGLFGGTAPNKTPLFGLSTSLPSSSSTPAPSGLFGKVESSNPQTSSSIASDGVATPLFGALLKPTAAFSSNFNNREISNSSDSTSKPEVKSSMVSESPFGALRNDGSSIFAKTTAAGTSTPSKSFAFNTTTSTTPAGPPPSENNAPALNPPLFPTKKPMSAEGTIFGGATRPESNSLFNKGGPPLFGAINTATTNTFPVSQSSLTALPTTSTTTSAKLPAQTSEPQAKSSSTLSSTVQTVSGHSSKNDLFSNPGNMPNTPNSVSGATTASAPSAVAALSLPKSDASKTNLLAPDKISSNNSATNDSATAASSNLPKQASDTLTQPETISTLAKKNKKDIPNGSSTTGPTPQMTRLKNKTMDDIITRWASDLSKYQKEFQDQASKVAEWDRLLVENGEKIQKLYLSTYEAERQNSEIERQLLNVESQQDEIATWLDKYESEIDEMFTRQVGPGDSLQGPDQEREKTYKLAEKLTDRLDEMGKNLTSMIDAINDASTSLSKTGKADDPLSSIVRVLNNHLATLQWIDENAEALKLKVEEAQKAGKSIGTNELGGLESENADYFYRSLVARK